MTKQAKEPLTADWWSVWKDEDAVYECPKDENGKRLGPLVGYAGKDDLGQHFVGDIYANLAIIERNPGILHAMAVDLASNSVLYDVDVFCGAPEGGKALALFLALETEATYCYPDQEVTEGTRNKNLVFQRHDEVLKGKSVAIVEDVMNNFSTTATLIKLIEAQGGKVVMIVGAFNRSLQITDSFEDIPVHALIQKPVLQYRQIDGSVSEDVKAGNLVLKPKAEWPRLKAAMQRFG